jgi:hypothetical protein
MPEEPEISPTPREQLGVLFKAGSLAKSVGSIAPFYSPFIEALNQESCFPLSESDGGLPQIPAATIIATAITMLAEITRRVRPPRKPPSVTIKISTAKADVRIAEVRNIFRE